jgi:iron(III) transport system ATP-binding protein
MRDGRFVQEGRPSDLFLRPADAFTAQFLGDAVILSAALSEGWADCALGRVATDDRRRGPGRIMLRPEQLRFVDPPADGRDATGCGTVQSIDYTGHDCMVTVQLGAGDDAVLVRCASHALPPMGAPVRVAVSGVAHVLSDRGA